MRTIHASSFNEYLDVLPTIKATPTTKEESGHSLLLFRGMKWCSSLNSSIAKYEEAAFKKDKALFWAFKDAYTNHGNPVGALCDLDLFALARHYGLPNRCLDWSGNPLIAFWFAIHEEGANGETRLVLADEKVVVWVLAPSSDDYAKNKSQFEIYPSGHSGKTKIFKAAPVTERIKAQESYLMRQVFVYRNGRRTNQGENLILEEVDNNATFRNKLTKIEFDLSADELERADNTLKDLGVHESFIFPDKESQQSKLLTAIVDKATIDSNLCGKE